MSIAEIMTLPPGRRLDYAVAMGLGWQIRTHHPPSGMRDAEAEKALYMLVPPIAMRESNPISLPAFRTEVEARALSPLPPFSTSAHAAFLLSRVPWFPERWALLEREFWDAGPSPAVPDAIYLSFKRGQFAAAKCKALLYWLNGDVVWRIG